MSALLRLIFFNRFGGVWWDSAVYIGMAKSMFGNFTFWEFLRPIGWPFILGSIWKAGFDMVIIGKFLEVLFSFGILILTYLIGKKLFNKKIAIFATFILCIVTARFTFGITLGKSGPLLNQFRGFSMFSGKRSQQTLRGLRIHSDRISVNYSFTPLRPPLLSPIGSKSLIAL